MPEVISNTTPFQYLHQIGCLDYLSLLYQHVIVPQAVVDELRQGKLKGVNVPSLDAIPWVIVESVALGGFGLRGVRASRGQGYYLVFPKGRLIGGGRGNGDAVSTDSGRRSLVPRSRYVDPLKKHKTGRSTVP